MGGATEETEGRAGETDTDTVLRRVRDSVPSHRRGTRGREEANSAGRATHAARIADEVHMDPPPQAHTGVGHDPEYTMPETAVSTHCHYVDAQ
ncbi:hypothetical protein TUSST3_00240 [Streptomyces sp. TUS-ST3]|nr:hypothetical protein TUSST3_00240 [Streptomyces sp. TUS-ST3]